MLSKVCDVGCEVCGREHSIISDRGYDYVRCPCGAIVLSTPTSRKQLRKKRVRPCSKTTERDDAIVAMRNNLSTLEAIGNKYLVTRERVRQILKQRGVPPMKLYYRTQPISKRCAWCSWEFSTKRQDKKTCWTVKCRAIRHAWTLAHRQEVRNSPEYKEHKNKMAKAYYHNVLKKLPNWKEIVRQRNVVGLKRRALFHKK